MFEIKVACPGRSWEETPVFLTGNEGVSTYDTGKQAALVHAIASLVARLFCDEVRWNYQGSLQGHYVGPPHCPICGFVFSNNPKFSGYRCVDPDHWRAAGIPYPADDPCQPCPGCQIMGDCPAEISQEVNHAPTTTL